MEKNLQKQKTFSFVLKERGEKSFSDKPIIKPESTVQKTEPIKDKR